MTFQRIFSFAAALLLLVEVLDPSTSFVRAEVRPAHAHSHQKVEKKRSPGFLSDGAGLSADSDGHGQDSPDSPASSDDDPNDEFTAQCAVVPEPHFVPASLGFATAPPVLVLGHPIPLIRSIQRPPLAA